MKLNYRGARPFVVLIKSPEFFLKSVSPDEQIEVSDRVGIAIMAAYPSDFEQVHDKVEKRSRKVVEDSEVK